MSKWIIVYFFKDESVEVVPDTWFFKGKCAWPKSTKNVKKLIEKQMKPNKNDFLFFSARKLGNHYYC